jgi:hypothetical protein
MAQKQKQETVAASAYKQLDARRHTTVHKFEKSALLGLAQGSTWDLSMVACVGFSNLNHDAPSFLIKRYLTNYLGQRTDALFRGLNSATFMQPSPTYPQ